MLVQAQDDRGSFLASGTGVVSQGDAALRTDHARDIFGVDGSGITIGILSDSLDAAEVPGSVADDIRAGELPASITALWDFDDVPGAVDPTDEGRAMAQIIHDIAPGATLLFHTSEGGIEAFAAGFDRLVDAGADIIVDDILYFAQPMFQDGFVAQAAQAAFDAGVAVFSAAGNSGADAYEAVFDPVLGDFVIDGDAYFALHDFDPGPGVDVSQAVRLAPGETISLTLQWDQPYASVPGGGSGSASDVDIYLLDQFGIAVDSGFDGNIGADPSERIFFTNETGDTQNFEIQIGVFDGPIPGLMRYVSDEDGFFLEYVQSSGTVYGHPAAEGVLSIGAADYQETPEFGLSPPALELFSSSGAGTPILFDSDGNRLAEPIFRPRVDLVGPDNVDTSFFGDDADGNNLPNFLGTSAAAPHIAAVAALMLEVIPSLTPAAIYDILTSTAIDMDDPFTGGFDSGVDEATGFGYVDALTALSAVAETDLVVGSLGDDTIDGTDGADTLFGDAGNDRYTVNNAGDTVIESSRGGFDRITLVSDLGNYQVPEHIEQLVLSDGASTATPASTGTKLAGLDNDNFFLSGPGTDFYDGNGGQDTLSYENAESGVEASLLKPTAFNTGGAGTDKIDDMEILIGSDFDDVLVGGQGVSNVIFGGPGNDLIVGFAGSDRLSGGPGNDIFAYNNLRFRDSLADGGEDTIIDFNRADDTIDLTRLGVSPDDLSIRGGRLEADVSGNGTADFAIFFDGGATPRLEDVLV